MFNEDETKLVLKLVKLGRYMEYYEDNFNYVPSSWLFV